MNQTDTHLDAIKFDDQGLLPAIAQDAITKDVLMVAWMNRTASLRPFEPVKPTISQVTTTLWHKGEQSGHVQHVKEIRLTAMAMCYYYSSTKWAALPATPADPLLF